MLLRNKRFWLVTGILVVSVLALSPFIGRHLAISAGTAGNPSRLKTRRPSWPIYPVNVERPEWRHNVPISVLVAESDAVVIGDALSNSCESTDDWRQVVTKYQIAVGESLSGSFEAGMNLMVTMPGGMARHPDGYLINVRTPSLVRMRNGDRFLLFLKQIGEGEFEPIRGSQGVYEIDEAHGRIHHLGANTRGSGSSIASVLRPVRDIIRNR